MRARLESALSGALGLALIVIAVPASAAGDADAGRAVALRWCTGCHVIRPLGTGPVVEGVPTFQAMARERTVEQLRAFLTHPHDPMPPLELSRVDIDNLVAYIETWR